MDSRENVNNNPDFPLKALSGTNLRSINNFFMFFLTPLQNRQSQLLTALACTVSSLMRTNATFSGTAGAERPQDTNAHPD